MIYGDTREGNGANPFLESSVKENNRKYENLNKLQGGGIINFQIRKLVIGDYCVLIKDRDLKPRLSLVIERKTWKDLSASIKDERITSQTKGLLDIQKKKGCLIMFLIEGNFSYKDDVNIENIPFKKLHAKVRHNLIRGIPYIQSRDEQHSAKLIVNLTRDILKLYANRELEFNPMPDKIEPEIIVSESEPELLKEYQTRILELNQEYLNKFKQFNKKPNLIEEVSRLVSDLEPGRILPEEISDPDLIGNEFEIPSEMVKPREIEDADILIKMWSSLPGISPKSAVLLMNNFHFYEVLTVKIGEMNNLKNKVMNLKFPSGIKFGINKAKTILDLAYLGEDLQKKEILKRLSLKLIREIPGISEKIAGLILDHFTLRDISNGFIIRENLTDLKSQTGRKCISDKTVEILFRVLKKPIQVMEQI